MKMIIRCAAQAARERRDPRHGHLRGIVSGHSSEGWIAGRLIAACEGQSGGRHHAVYPEPERIENPRTKRMRLAHREESHWAVGRMHSQNAARLDQLQPVQWIGSRPSLLPMAQCTCVMPVLAR